MKLLTTIAGVLLLFPLLAIFALIVAEKGVESGAGVQL